MFFAKSSLLMLYYRLFRAEKLKHTRRLIIFGIASSFIFYSGMTIYIGILCAPKVGHPWDWTIARKCMRGQRFGIVIGAVNLALDVFLLGLPLPVISSLQLSAKRKTGVLAIFMIGLLWAHSCQTTRLIWRSLQCSCCEYRKHGLSDQIVSRHRCYLEWLGLCDLHVSLVLFLSTRHEI